MVLLCDVRAERSLPSRSWTLVTQEDGRSAANARPA